MKLSEITGERAVDAIAELIQPIANIAGDKDSITKLFDRKTKKGETTNDAALRVLKENVPILLKTHKADILQIISIINDVNPDTLTLPEIIKGTFDVIGDEDFMALFMSAVPKEARQQPTGSSEPQGTSKPE